MDKELELHVLGASQGGLHPLWSQMLTHNIASYILVGVVN
jgi:hypothetical protein